MATPAEPRGEKKLFFVQILGGEKLLKFVESAGEKLLSGLRGAKNVSNTFRIVFPIFFSRFSSPFSCQIKTFSGAVSFCRRAAVTITVFCAVGVTPSVFHLIKGTAAQAPKIGTFSKNAQKLWN